MSKKHKAYIITDTENRLYGAFAATKEGKEAASQYCEKLQKTRTTKLKVKIKA